VTGLRVRAGGGIAAVGCVFGPPQVPRRPAGAGATRRSPLP
jgi:hypothetical protein